MDISKSISIVIPNFNGVDLLRQYLPYTYTAVKNTGSPYEIIVVDDFSSDNSIEFLKTTYPEIIVISNNEHNGLAHTYNQGIAVSQYELILLLDSNVKLSRDYFESQWKYFLSWDTFGVMGRITDLTGNQIQDAARLPKWNGYKLRTSSLYYPKSKQNRLFTLNLSGTNSLINAKKLKETGGFNEMFSTFDYGVLELSLRAWQLKWLCYYEHDAICYQNSTENSPSIHSAENEYFKDQFYMHVIHLNGWGLIAWYFQIMLTEVMPKLLSGKWWIWNSFISLVTNRKLIKQSKKQFQILMADEESEVTLNLVVKKIRNSMNNKKDIERYRYKAMYA